MNITEEKKVSKEKENGKSICRILRLIWNAGYQFIPILLATTIILSFMYRCDNGYHLVKNGHSVAIDSLMIVSLDRDTTILALNSSARQDSAIVRILNRQEPNEDSKGSYLSLWAAALAVIFVVFSIFGVLKLELTKKDIEDMLKDVDSIINELNQTKKTITDIKQYGLSTQRITNLIKESSHDYKSTRERRIDVISRNMNELANLNLEIDYYGILLEIYSMNKIDSDEEGERMHLIIRFLNKDKLTLEKLILLGKSYYRLYTILGQNNKDKQDYLRNSILVYCSILQTNRNNIIDDELFKKMELPIKNISNDIQLSFEENNEINDILYELSRGLYDYALNYCDENLKQDILQKASSILKTITK